MADAPDLEAVRAALRDVSRAGGFNRWLKAKGKLGGQHKVPRLSNERKWLEEILPFINE